MTDSSARCEVVTTDATHRLVIAGDWQLHGQIPDAQACIGRLPEGQPASLVTEGLGEWDSSLPAFLLRLQRESEARGIALDASALPERLARLFALAVAVPPTTQACAGEERRLFAQVGHLALDSWHNLPRNAAFAGEIALSLMRLVRGKAQMRSRDLWLQIDLVGPRALPIVSLISFLVGTILAYMGAVQLAQFGAQIYIADLVAIGMTREIGALMTGIILAGRTGAAFAAQIGSMQAGEEVDALTTLGISPIDHLVLPRMLALVIMTPLLTLYAGFVGILAGLLVANTVFNVGIAEYWYETLSVMTFAHISVGLVKGAVYGALVAFAGCLRGIHCGRSAQSVGDAATSAVVTGILLITIFASVLTVIFQKLGI
ncbi:ABC transporter permease [Uliginosibacterium sp. H1]|uniref:ABC transporter permease n=1 Tax=Uliginosibacterium sp. H1 TaxID=3114757 RepID=UPI002E188B2E|nr:ABC transporter permease [Uliginosibacterium sp. H1]